MLWLFGALMAAIGVIWFGARSSGRALGTKDAEIEATKGYAETREKIDHAEIAADPDAARKWLRDRAGKP